MRTQDEILKEIKSRTDASIFGFDTEVLVFFLDVELAAPFFGDPLLAEDWVVQTEEKALADSLAYLGFAIGKAENHRGISAGRSVDKLRAWAWVLNRDDVVTAMDEADYTNYGAPKLRAFAYTMGEEYKSLWEKEVGEDSGVAQMAKGQTCSDYCEEGCG